MGTHTHTVSTLALRAGDAVLPNGGRIVASVERSMDDLGAALIRFTDGTWFHAGIRDAHAISRPEPTPEDDDACHCGHPDCGAC